MPAADGLHRGPDHGGVGQQELQRRGGVARAEGRRQRETSRGWGRTRPVSGWSASPEHVHHPPGQSATGAVSMPRGFSLGVIGAGITIGGVGVSQHRGGPPGLPEGFGRFDTLDAAAPDAQQRGRGDQRGEERSLHHAHRTPRPSSPARPSAAATNTRTWASSSRSRPTSTRSSSSVSRSTSR